MARPRPGVAVLVGLLGLVTLAQTRAQPAAAQERANNEALVLRLIFDDCLGFVRDGTPPFAGLALAPLRPEVEAGLSQAAKALPDRHQLLSQRYFAYWGESGADRICVISATDDYARFPPLLTVRHEGFMARVSQMAVANGLTDHDLPERFDMFGTPKWSEPGEDPSELRIVAIPFEPTIEGVPIDMGVVIVAKGRDGPSS
ncbi:MAG: hypothetical protein MUE83_08515 [Tabrizicola sp.]|jgi:hypothetical protein|nr:hypothetical protein [Tabrizicola sp.]